MKRSHVPPAMSCCSSPSSERYPTLFNAYAMSKHANHLRVQSRERRLG